MRIERARQVALPRFVRAAPAGQSAVTWKGVCECRYRKKGERKRSVLNLDGEILLQVVNFFFYDLELRALIYTESYIDVN